jgi:hypothetical protein
MIHSTNNLKIIIILYLFILLIESLTYEEIMELLRKMCFDKCLNVDPLNVSLSVDPGADLAFLRAYFNKYQYIWDVNHNINFDNTMGSSIDPELLDFEINKMIKFFPKEIQDNILKSIKYINDVLD